MEKALQSIESEYAGQIEARDDEIRQEKCKKGEERTIITRETVDV